jgi:hypothetical protein
VRLLLDEMLSAEIAEKIRSRGHDAVAVDKTPELRGLPDRELFGHAQEQERAIVTYDREDFLALDREYRSRQQEHYGIAILHPRRFPQGAGSIGSPVTALASFVEAGSPYPSFIHWLQ